MIGRKDPAATGKAWNTGGSNAKTQREEWACWVLEIERWSGEILDSIKEKGRARVWRAQQGV